MKRDYSKETLFYGVFALGTAACYQFGIENPNSFLSLCWAGIGCLNIYRAFSPEAVERESEEKAIRRDLFGSFGFLVAWGPVAIAVGLLALLFRTSLPWLCILSLVGVVAMLGVAIWYTVLIEKHRKKKTGGV